MSSLWSLFTSRRQVLPFLRSTFHLVPLHEESGNRNFLIWLIVQKLCVVGGHTFGVPIRRVFLMFLFPVNFNYIWLPKGQSKGLSCCDSFCDHYYLASNLILSLSQCCPLRDQPPIKWEQTFTTTRFRVHGKDQREHNAPTICTVL